MSTRLRRALALTLLILLVATVAPAATTATFPGVNGRLTFMRFDDNGEFQVWVANPDMTTQVQLTYGPGSDAWFPSWSPDGSRIAFSSHRADPDPNDEIEASDIFTMRSDGSDVRKLTDSGGFHGNPSWSPDGHSLVFASDRGPVGSGQRIFIMPSDGSSQPVPITSVPAGSLGQELARFSPDGKRIVFNEVRLFETPDGLAEQSALFTVAIDGSKRRRVTPWDIFAADADWSPDGKRLVFSARLPESDFVQSVMTIDADGAHLKLVTRGDMAHGDGAEFRYQESFNPAWSPDGRLIVFVRASYTDADGFAMGLHTMRPNGTGLLALSFGEEHQPDWGSAPAIP
jgi:TolB protein